MRRYARSTAILAAGTALALTLAGCGSDSGSGGGTSAGADTSAAAATSHTAAADGTTSSGDTSEAAPGTSTAGGSESSAGTSAPSGGTVTLTISTNGISGGKNAQEADWITNWVIPEFTKAEAAKGVTVQVSYQSSGVDDEKYKAKLALDLKAGSGPDVFSIDGIWVGEFAQAGYIKPLEDVVGADYQSWDGLKQINEAVQGNATFDGKLYGLPTGTDGRVLYYNKKLFQQAGLPADWHPASWDDIFAAADKLKSIDGVTPLQMNAGTAMGEATTMQGILPLLAGTGAQIYTDGKWLGNTQQLRDVLSFYDKAYNTDQVGDPDLQLDAKGRDESFAEFAAGKIGILAESDYFWRSVVNPKDGVAPMKDRNDTVGYTLIPAQKAGAGIRGQDFVSMSGGAVYTLNPNSKNAKASWDLMTFMLSPEAIEARLGDQAQITSRDDVNKTVLANDPMLTFVATKVLPLTAYRPGLAEYPEVSMLLQQATADVVSGTSVDDAAASYQEALEKLVGADKVTSG
ncbi:extracellular solute-binding protein [Nakamurella lactea]|uniref:extracellular solute-binding protein n=1 Tax=Nakamurella lactea TaxID=459515 RepID=UPI00041470C8|nr:extracellular solute-binding protein [Nakamurella lactea]